ncbi:terminase, partial [Acinetobacter baumannii]
RGYNVSKSSVHRYGQKVEQKLAAVQASTQAAMMIADAAPDDSDMRSSAVLSLVQTELFNALIALQESENPDADPADRIMLMAKAGKGIAEIAKASVNQKKWESEVKERVQAAAKEVDKIVKKSGLSKETANEIRKQILGITS